MKIDLFRLIVAIILLVLVSSIIFFSVQNEKDEAKKVADVVKSYFDKSLRNEKVNLLTLTLALAENSELKEAIKADDEELGYQILSRLSSKFKKYTHLQNMKIQVMTNDKFLFARSWESGFSGIPLWWFRDDLNDVINNQEPRVGVEIGMILTLRATVSIKVNQDTILGYIENIRLLDELAKNLRKDGIELFVLMDQEYLKKASLMRENSRLDNFVLSNMGASKRYLSHLEKLPFDVLEQEHLLYNNGVLFVHEYMYNARGKKLGAFVLAVTPETYEKIISNQSRFSLLQSFSNQELYSIVKSWEKPLGGFKKHSDREIVEFLPKLNKDDREEFKRKAREFLKNYTKDELIDIILNVDKKVKKVGEIR